MIVGNYFITVQSCLFYQSVPIVGLLLGVLLPLLISCDRLCSCFFSHFHSNLNLVAYASFICSICSFYVAFNFYMIIKYIHKTEDTLVLCLVPEPLSFRKENNLIFQLTSVSINVTAILIYVVVWTGLHCQKRLVSSKKKRSTLFSDVSEVTKRAFKALTAIIVALLIGWVAGPTSQLILIRLEAEPMQMFYSIAISGVCINIVCATNCIWLFVFSSDYRNAFRHEFKRNTSKVTSIINFK
ncbi:hypothetical protein M3Y98_01225200 [Aphelenchoides besseyi]|nr:hypothetical protein M3Y98_01225200 [Aphelenchoides besseyi]